MRFVPAAALVGALGLALAAPAAAHEAGHGTTPSAGVAAPGAGGAAATPLPLAIGGPFALVDQTGRPVTDRDFRGRYMLVFFGYASCPGLCPMALKTMADAVDELGDDGGRVAPVLITVDPVHDRPENLADAVAKIHPRLTGLTGTPEQLAAAAKAYGVSAKPAGRSWTGVDLFEHGPFVYLMGPDGKLLTLFPPVLDGAAMAATIRGYLG